MLCAHHAMAGKERARRPPQRLHDVLTKYFTPPWFRGLEEFSLSRCSFASTGSLQCSAFRLVPTALFLSGVWDSEIDIEGEPETVHLPAHHLSHHHVHETAV